MHAPHPGGARGALALEASTSDPTSQRFPAVFSTGAPGRAGHVPALDPEPVAVAAACGDRVPPAPGLYRAAGSGRAGRDDGASRPRPAGGARGAAYAG